MLGFLGVPSPEPEPAFPHPALIFRAVALGHGLALVADQGGHLAYMDYAIIPSPVFWYDTDLVLQLTTIRRDSTGFMLANGRAVTLVEPRHLRRHVRKLPPAARAAMAERIATIIGHLDPDDGEQPAIRFRLLESWGDGYYTLELDLPQLQPPSFLIHVDDRVDTMRHNDCLWISIIRRSRTSTYVARDEAFVQHTAQRLARCIEHLRRTRVSEGMLAALRHASTILKG